MTVTGGWRARAREYALLMRWDRPIGALLLLWPMLWALLIAARGLPDPWVLAVFVAGVWIMRSAGCVMNDYADRDIDPHVERTRDRPLAARRVTSREALALFAALAAVAFALVLTLDRLTVAMSFVGLALAASYPFSKRFHHLPQLHLGLAFGWAVPMAFAAQAGEVPPVGWAVFAAAVAWAMVYDTVYAMVDREDDLAIGVKSSAILFGRADVTLVGVFHAAVLALLVLVGYLARLGPAYHAGLAVAAGLAGYQMWLIRGRDRDGCFRAFLNNNWYGAAVFAGVAAHYAISAPG